MIISLIIMLKLTQKLKKKFESLKKLKVMHVFHGLHTMISYSNMTVNLKVQVMNHGPMNQNQQNILLSWKKILK